MAGLQGAAAHASWGCSRLAHKCPPHLETLRQVQGVLHLPPHPAKAAQAERVPEVEWHLAAA